MEIKLLKTSILTNNIPKFLIFIEDEIALSDMYKEKISKMLNKPIKVYSSCEHIAYDLQTNVISDSIFVINEDKPFDNHALEIIKNSGKNCIICTHSVDNIKNKDLLVYCVHFKKLDHYTVLAYLMKKLKDKNIAIEQDSVEKLVDYCEDNLGECLNELDKVITLVDGSSSEINNKIVMDYMLECEFSDYRQTNVKAFTDKVCAKNTEAIDEVYRLSDSPIYVLSLLYAKARYSFITYKRPYSKRIMEVCYEIYKGILSNTIDSEYAMKYLVEELYG